MNIELELQGKTHELEYLLVQIDHLKQDILSLKGEIYELEQIQSAATVED